MNSKVSVLIANYNNGSFFKDCYQSLIAQTYKGWEAVILDDCSTDNSLELISDLVKEDSRFKIFRNEENKGIGFTKRKLIQLSENDICGFLDPDDALEIDALEVILKAHYENPETGLVYSNFVYCDEHLAKMQSHKAKQITTLDESYYNFNGEISHFVSFKKHIYLKTSGIDPFLKIAEDKDWYMKMCEVAPVLHIDIDLYLYRIHHGGISTNTNTEKAVFWHWVAMMKMAERRSVNIEELFLKQYAYRHLLEKEVHKNVLHENFRSKLKKSKWLKLGKMIGLFKNFDEL